VSVYDEKLLLYSPESVDCAGCGELLGSELFEEQGAPILTWFLA
jgi:hypothetical protein